MSPAHRASSPQRPARVLRLLASLTLGLVLLTCCYLLDLWQAVPPLRYAWMNTIPQVQGHLELIAPGQCDPGATLSPDGRTLWLHGTWQGPRQYLLWDLLTDTRHAVSLTEPRSFRWLDSDWLVVYGFFSGSYALIDVRTGLVRPLESYPHDRFWLIGGQHAVANLIADATTVYVIDQFPFSGYMLISLSPHATWRIELAYGEGFGWNRAQLEAWLKTLPLIDQTPDGIGGPSLARTRVFSHDGQFYATRESRGEAARLAIYRTQDEQLVASAYKPRWGPAILGWDSTDQWVYFAQRISGSAGPLSNPESPIFKLRPLTPAEARGQALRRGLGWGGGVLVCGGVAWWLVRRWRRGRAAA